jgi:hypothetical protein
MLPMFLLLQRRRKKYIILLFLLLLLLVLLLLVVVIVAVGKIHSLSDVKFLTNAIFPYKQYKYQDTILLQHPTASIYRYPMTSLAKTYADVT